MQITPLNPDTLHRNPAFSQAVAVDQPQRLIFVGGQNAVNAQAQIVGADDLAVQVGQALHNLNAALEAGGAALKDVVKWTIYLVQGQSPQAGFAAFQPYQAELVHAPAITVVIVAGLGNPAFLVEIEAIAAV